MVNCHAYWYRKMHFISFLLLPLSWLFALGVGVRRWLYRRGLLAISHFKIPIIIVGNITAGGTGKTPFVIWLAHFLQLKGFRPGIVTRGVGGRKQRQAHWVSEEDTTRSVGDEAKLLLHRTGCPVVIGVNRAAAVRALVQQQACNIVISDDGLQHYRLGRTVEIAMVDGKRRFGNQRLIPAGPLREPVKRLDQVDMVVVKEGSHHDEFIMRLVPLEWVSLHLQQKTIQLADFPPQKVHAVAGIGYPEGFFELLKQMGFDVIEHTFPDHYCYRSQDLNFSDDLPIMMTEKDAVKCSSFADERYWYLRMTVKVNDKLEKHLGKIVGSLS